MPLVPQAAQKKAELYGVKQNDNTKTFQERLMERFQPTEFVTVMNVDTEVFTWQYMPASSEEFSFTEDPMKITHRGQPELWEIQPGERETIVGANAYVMMDGLYKKMVAKKRLSESPETPGQAINFNYSDSGQQEKWIDKILIGKATPTFAPVGLPEEDLGLLDAATDAAKKLVTSAAAKKA